MTGYLKKFLVILVVFLSFLGLSGCDNMEDQVDNNYNYLSVCANNEYGVGKIEPKLGRYAYKDETIVDINFEEADGYDFLGWRGSDSNDIVEISPGRFQIAVNRDKSIEAELELKEFMFLSLRFGNQDSISRDELGSKNHRINHDTNEIEFRFNNDIGTSEEAFNIYFENQSYENEENDNDGLIDNTNITIEDNIITVEISNNFFEQELGFGEKYLITGDRTDNSIRVSDIEGKSTRIESFEVATETVKPESPFLSIEEVSETEIELFWSPSKDNKVGYGENYVSKYNIYRSTDKDKFSDNPYDIKEVSNPEEISEINYNDTNLDVDQIYSYKVTAVLDKNEYQVHWDDGNQESEPSNIVDNDF